MGESYSTEKKAVAAAIQAAEGEGEQYYVIREARSFFNAEDSDLKFYVVSKWNFETDIYFADVLTRDVVFTTQIPAYCGED